MQSDFVNRSHQLSSLLEKSAKNLQASEKEDIGSFMVLTCLSETQETEGFTWDSGNLEIRTGEHPL